MQYRVSGPNVTELRDIAFRLAQIVASDSRSRRVNFDWIEPGRKIRVRIDQDQARLLGLSSESIAAVMNTVMSGAAVTQVRDGMYLVDVVMRATDEQRISLSTLRNLQFPLPNGRTVPLGVFATLDFEQEFPLIWRRTNSSTEGGARKIKTPSGICSRTCSAPCTSIFSTTSWPSLRARSARSRNVPYRLPLYVACSRKAPFSRSSSNCSRVRNV